MVNHQLDGKPAAGISLLVIFRLFEGSDDDCMHTQLGTLVGGKGGETRARARDTADARQESDRRSDRRIVPNCSVKKTQNGTGTFRWLTLLVVLTRGSGAYVI
jgi:hypothetical protein